MSAKFNKNDYYSLPRVKEMVPPPPEPFEVAISTKITTSRKPLLQTFVRIDEDEDGLISKKDLKNALNNMYEMALDDDQIDVMFRRSQFFSERRILRQGSDSSTEEERDEKNEQLISFPVFQEYMKSTADGSDSVSPTKMYGSTINIKVGFRTDAKLPWMDDRRSVVAKKKDLRNLVLETIQQSIPSESVGMATTHTFLEMDTLRNNQVTKSEFISWLRVEKGLELDEEEVKLVLGEWQKEEGLTLQEYGFFVTCLENKCTDTEKIKQLTENQRPDEAPLVRDDDGKSDTELIWALRGYFHGVGKSFMQGFHELDKSDGKTISSSEVSDGLRTAGLVVTHARSKELMKGFVKPGGDMDKPGYVRFITSAPENVLR